MRLTITKGSRQKPIGCDQGSLARLYLIQLTVRIEGKPGEGHTVEANSI